MKYLSKIIIVLLLAVSVTAVMVLKKKDNSPSEAVRAQPLTETNRLPKLVDLGADKCIPCKMMAPILEELKQNYAGTFNVEFIDVWKKPEKAKEYGISIIPTQIFYDSSGKELFRHEGFFSKEDILAEWKELGVEPVKAK